MRDRIPKDDGSPAPAQALPPEGAQRLGALDLEAHLADPSRKQAFVTPMFDTIAPRYDRFTRLFSFGMDAAWKRAAIEAIGATLRAPAPTVLDLACGTGDLAIGVARAIPGAEVTALDVSPRMIDEARRRLTGLDDRDDIERRVRPMVGDMTAIGVPAASVDLVTAGYGVRNTPSAEQAVREMRRVMRPGALLVTLDFYRPELALWRALFLRYLHLAGNAVGWWWHRDPVVYGYIARSIDHFMSWQQFSALLAREGFRVTRVERYLGGAIARHEATAV